MNSEDNVVYYSDMKKQIRKKKVKDKFHQAGKAIVDTGKKIGTWAVNNPAQASVITLGAFGVTKKIISYEKVKAEEKRRDCDFWDPREGTHTISSRKLKPDEKLEESRLYKQGLSHAEALARMGLLKY